MAECFFLFSQKSIENPPDFYCWVPIRKATIWEVFRAETQNSDFWPELLNVPYVFSKIKEMHPWFPLLSP